MTELNEKGDSWIVARLEEVRWRNRNDDNPNLKKTRMIFDFKQGKICVEAARGEAA